MAAAISYIHAFVFEYPSAYALHYIATLKMRCRGATKSFGFFFSKRKKIKKQTCTQASSPSTKVST